MVWNDASNRSAGASDERRGKFRFPMQRELRYKLYKDGAVLETGVGETINIGSGGVRFSMEHEASIGAFVQLSISWPVLLDQSCPMRLIIFGRVVRAGSGTCACTVDKYEFRTQGRAFQPSGPRTDAMLERWVENVRKDNLKSEAATA